MRRTPLIATSLLLSASATAAPAGDLTPPGAPGSTMKALDIVEPRTPITQDDIPMTINRPGSYYLTSDLFPVGVGDNIITVIASNVTIDLRGFTIDGATEVTAAADGIELADGVDNIAIFNGRIIDAQADGISGFNATGVTVRDVRVHDVGDDAIQLGSGAKVIDCAVFNAGGDGITALAGDARFVDCQVSGSGAWCFIAGVRSVVTGCIANEGFYDGFQVGGSSVVENCTAQNNSQNGFNIGGNSTVRGSTATGNVNNGFSLGTESSTISGCTANSNGDDGISASRGATIVHNAVAGNGSNGIFVSADCAVIENTVRNNGIAQLHSGIHIGVGDCRVEGNTLVGNHRGVNGSAAGGSFIARNTVRNSPAGAYTLGAGNVVGQIYNFAGGGTINNVVAAGNGNPPGPWSNFEY